jgi:hypothetical protein
MLDFKLNYYFEMLKDKPFRNSREFKNNFKKKYGDFKHLNKLFVIVSNYQAEKYGGGLCTSYYRATKEDHIKISNASNHRKWYWIKK